MFENYTAQLAPHCIFGDKRRSKRFLKLLDTLGTCLGKRIPQGFQNRAQAKGAYRFFANPHITPFMIRAAERDRLVDQVRTERPAVLLAVQDTTTLNYSSSRAAEQLGVLQAAAQKGFYVHSQVLLRATGMYLGLFDQQCWNRDVTQLGVKKAQRKALALEEKESYRWLAHFEQLQATFAEDSATTIIQLGDRESDIYEVLAARAVPHVHYLIRARGDRVDQESGQRIRPALLLREPTVKESCSLEVFTHDPAQRRLAEIQVRFTQLTLQPNTESKGRAARQPMPVTVVWAREVNAPDTVAQPIDWLLFSSLPAETLEAALQLVNYYRLRWRIEQFHYVLKSGCAVEQLQLEQPPRLEKAIATYSLLARRVLALQYLARQADDQTLAAVGIERQAYQVGAQYLNTKAGGRYDIHKAEPTVQDFVRVVAQLGGSMLQRGKPIGTKILWRGLRELDIILQAFQAFLNGP